MKTISILLATVAFLAGAVAAAGFDLNVVVLLPIGCAACIVGVFVHDYSRKHRVRIPMRVPRPERHRAPVIPNRLPSRRAALPSDSPSTAGGSPARTLFLIHVPIRPGEFPRAGRPAITSTVASTPLVTLP